jgi:hypothetical protein
LIIIKFNQAFPACDIVRYNLWILEMKGPQTGGGPPVILVYEYIGRSLKNQPADSTNNHLKKRVIFDAFKQVCSDVTLRTGL